VLQPFLIPSESMERTLLVGDFLLFNKRSMRRRTASASGCCRIVRWSGATSSVFHHPQPPLLIKRVVGIPGDRLRIADGRVLLNGVALDEPYAAFEPAPLDDFRDNFPATIYTDPTVDPEWWRQIQSLTGTGNWWCRRESTLCWATNRNHSKRFAVLGVRAAAARSWLGRW